MVYKPEYPVTSLSKPFPAGDIQEGWAFDQTVEWVDAMERPLRQSAKRKKAEAMIAEVQEEWVETAPFEQRMVHGRALVLTNRLDVNQPDGSTTRGYLAAHSMSLVKGVLPVDYDPSLYTDLTEIDKRLVTSPKTRREFTTAAWKGMRYSHGRVHKLLGTVHENLTRVYELTDNQRFKQKLGVALFYTAATHGHLLTTTPEYSAMKHAEFDPESKTIYHLEELVTDEVPLADRRSRDS